MVYSRIGTPTGRLRARTGYTLVELLVVLAIVGIIITLSAAAAIQILASTRASNTSTALLTLTDILNRQWGEVVRQAKTETIPQGIVNMAGGDQSRARVIWIKLRLKQEFPMNFSEAIYPWGLPPSQITQADPYIHQSQQFAGDPDYGGNSLPGKPSYVQALRNAGVYIPAAGETASATLTIPASTHVRIPDPINPNVHLDGPGPMRVP
jgi:prepilin-type N-terminal cleavage/methylation domain-containing protein